MNISLPYRYALRSYQVPAWKYMQGTEEGKRAVCVWHRRAGKDLFAINLIATKVFERVGTYWHLLPTYRQGRAIVWNGFTREGRKFLDAFPKELVESIHMNEMRVTFKNGSIYQVVGTDDVDNLVGTNPVGCVFSEYSLQDPKAWDYIRPILAENGGWSMFIYTPRGKTFGWRLLKHAQTAGWFVDIRKAGSDGTRRDGKLFIANGSQIEAKDEDGSPVISDASIENERKAGMSEEMIQQEFYVSFESSIEGAYYAKEMTKAYKDSRITRVPYDPKLPVDTSWDLGVGDATAIIFSQTYGLEERLIDYYENSGEGLAHYIRVLKEKEYVYGVHHAPWDIDVREFTSGKSRLESARALGIKFKVTQKHSVEDGIEQSRSIFSRLWIDGEKCERLINALSCYCKEPLSSRLQMNGDMDGKKAFKDVPLHNWASNPADAFRIFAWNRKFSRLSKGEKRYERAEDCSDLAMPTW